MFDFDLPSVDGIEKFQKTGGMLPAGKYHVRLDGAKPTTAGSGAQGTELYFTVIGGPFVGQEIKETLWQSEKEGAKNRLVLFGSRLGLLKPEGGKFVRVAGKSDFADAIGADVVVEVERQEYVTKDGKKGNAARITFGGIWSSNDPSVKGVPKASSNSVPVPAPKPRVDTSTL